MSPDIHQLWSSINGAELTWQRPDLTWPEWKDHFAWSEATDLPSVTDRQVYRSATTLEAGQLLPPAGFVLVEAWSAEPYRLIWSSYTDRILLTYCEGDLSYVTCATAEAATLARRQTWAFYRDLAR